MRRRILVREPRQHSMGASLAWMCRTALSVCVAAGACDQSTAPLQKQGSELHFLNVAQNAAEVAADTTKFYAKVGRAGVVTVWNTDSTKFADFTYDDQALSRSPDGQRFTAGDSIQIMIIVPDRSQIAVRFSPTGLTFDPQHAPHVRLYFAGANPDVNGDGVVDQADTDALQKLSMWRQEAVGQAWYQMSSNLSLTARTVDATVTGFSSFGAAF